MDVRDLLVELFGRLPDLVRGAVADLDADTLVAAPAQGANTIGWLVWHLTRVQDSHVADLLDEDQLWVTGDWAPRFGLDPDPDNTGYGHSPVEVAAVRPVDAAVLVDYYDAVAARTGSYVRGLSAADLDEVIDEGWDPPVTLGVRLVSIADDDFEHVGQAAYVRGLVAPPA